MTLIEKIRKESGGVISYKSYEANDLATSYDVKFVTEKSQLLKSVFSETSEESNINSLDGLRLYFLAKKFHEMENVIPFIVNDNNKEIVRELSSICGNYIGRIDLGAVIKFINTSYKRVFSKNKPDHELFDVVLSLVLEYGNGINKEVWLFLADEYGYRLLHEYPKIKKRLFDEEYGQIMFEKMISISTSSQLIGYHLKDVFAVLADIIVNHKTSTLCVVAKQKVDQIFEIVNSLNQNDITERGLFIKDDVYRKTLAFLRTIKDKRANQFATKAKGVEKELNSWLKANGKSISYKIPTDKIIDEWRNLKNWEIRLLYLTHDIRKENNTVKVTSRIAECEKPESFLDFCSTNFSTDSYFTYSRQLALQMILAEGGGTLFCILRDDKDTEEFLRLIISAAYHIQEKIKTERSESLLQDIEMLISAIETIRHNKDKGDIKSLYYAASMLSCAISEKILKTVVENEMCDIQYVEMKSLELGSMLNAEDPNNPLIEIFGKNHLRHLAFFLCVCGNNRVGYELRNSLAHLSDSIEDKLGEQLLAQLLWLLGDVLNTAFWHLSSK